MPPRFIKQPTDRSSSEKEDIEFECEIYGKPEPTVEWMKNGDVITQNEYLQVKTTSIAQLSRTWASSFRDFDGERD